MSIFRKPDINELFRIFDECFENCIFLKKSSSGLTFYCEKYQVIHHGCKTKECKSTPNSIDFINSDLCLK